MTRFDIDAASGRAEWNYLHLQELRYSLRERIGDFAAFRAGYELYREMDPARLVHHFTTDILGKTTGPRTYEASESATAVVVGFATWWDMFKATYRSRWWMRWRRWGISYVERTETKVATVRVEANLAVLFPHAEASHFPKFLGPPYSVVLSAGRSRNPVDR